MTAKELRSLLFDVPEDSEIVLLNVNAPVRCTEPIKGQFTKSGDNGTNLVLMYGKEKEEKEGSKYGR